jgi:hypothetical protein
MEGIINALSSVARGKSDAVEREYQFILSVSRAGFSRYITPGMVPDTPAV